jgi:glycosyltransferase involved in cell wall biosynthesis
MVISVIMPCLNEAQTIRTCVKRAKLGMRAAGVNGEIIVVDNGSTDGSADIARKAGARILKESSRGYGNALRAGLSASQKKFLIFGDCDGTYDFRQIPAFVRQFKAGYDCVIGSRIKGKILPGAMPWTHRYIGVPLLSQLLRTLFSTGITDTFTGFRACTRDAYKRMHLHSIGMEFASDFIIAAAQNHLSIAEIPITYYPRIGKSKLRVVRDGFRHVIFILGAKVQSL